MEEIVAVQVLTKIQVLDNFASLPPSHKELLLELVTNYLFDMAQEIKVPFDQIDQKDKLYKALDFLSQGWTYENSLSYRWRFPL